MIPYKEKVINLNMVETFFKISFSLLSNRLKKCRILYEKEN